MGEQARGKARQLGIKIGRLPVGKKNCITDVADVHVGHHTLDIPLSTSQEAGEALQEHVCTGVTAILPHGGNLFREKVTAASYVLNGFGKTTGLVQVNELGVIEAPIMLTNTFSVPAVTQGTLQYMLNTTPEIGETTSTINIVVGECNDSYLNSIRQLYVTPDHAREAINNATTERAEEGAIGAGKGMICFGYKGGIGSSSRVVACEGIEESYTVGCLVLSNFGKKEELLLEKYKVDQDMEEQATNENNTSLAPISTTSDGSIIIVLATDAPLSDRQLQRVAKRCGIGLGRTGSHFSHGSGDIVIAFSTAKENLFSHFAESYAERRVQLREDHPVMNLLFTAAAEATEEAILNSLTQAVTTAGRKQRIVPAFRF